MPESDNKFDLTEKFLTWTLEIEVEKEDFKNVYGCEEFAKEKIRI